MPTLRIVYSSTSGHTEYVCDILIAHLKEKKAPVEIVMTHVEQSKPEHLLDCDYLLLASSTWDPTEGLWPPDFRAFIKEAKEIDLMGKPTCVIGLGDSRYRNTCKATAHLMQFAREHGGKNLLAPLPIVNEPYEQDETVRKWGDKLLEKLTVPAS
jgi:flavodoxin I